MAVTPITVTVVIPEVIREQNGKFTCEASHNVKMRANQGPKGTPFNCFFQVQAMNRIEGTVSALETLDPTGEVTILIASGIVQVEANLCVVNSVCKSLIEEVLESVERDARQLLRGYPEIEFTLNYGIKTTFAIIAPEKPVASNAE